MTGREYLIDFATQRSEPEGTLDERDTITGFLEYYRATIAVKCAGLQPEQLADRNCDPSPMSLLGLVRHLGDVERYWWHSFAGEPTKSPYCTKENPDGDFLDAVGDQAGLDDAVAYWNAGMEYGRQVETAHSLEDTFVDRHGRTLSVRWILVHLIEEYARHAGHADFLRERVDGATGD